MLISNTYKKLFLAARLEEREADQKNEFDKLHERYNVLLRTHIDHMERTKYLLGNEKFDMLQNMPLPSSQVRNKYVNIFYDFE